MTVGSDVKSCYYSVKNAEATLEQFMLSSTSPDYQVAYREALQLLTEVKQELNEQVLFLAREEPQY